MATNQTFKDWLKQEYQRRGDSQFTLAGKLGLSEQQVWRVASGRSRPSRNFLVKLADVYALPVADVLRAGGYDPGEPGTNIPANTEHSPAPADDAIRRVAVETVRELAPQIAEDAARRAVHAAIEELRRTGALLPAFAPPPRPTTEPTTERIDTYVDDWTRAIRAYAPGRGDFKQANHPEYRRRHFRTYADVDEHFDALLRDMRLEDEELAREDARRRAGR